MKILIESIAIIISLAVSVLAGYFLYVFIEGLRLDLYCTEFREGLDCYQEGWNRFPIWLFSLVGGFVAVLSITLVCILRPSSRLNNSKITLGVGSIVALPLTLMLGGPVAFIATVASGITAFLVVLRLTKQSSGLQ